MKTFVFFSSYSAAYWLSVYLLLTIRYRKDYDWNFITGVTVNRHFAGSMGPYDSAREITDLKEMPFEYI